jgi:hypothetical protein
MLKAKAIALLVSQRNLEILMQNETVEAVNQVLMEGLAHLESNEAIDNFDDAFFFLRAYFLARFPNDELARRFQEIEAQLMKRRVDARTRLMNKVQTDVSPGK